MPRIFVAIAAAALSIVAGAVYAAPTLPAMGDSAYVAFSSDTETAIGRQIVRSLRAAGHILDDPETTEYLQSLGQRIGSHSSVPGQAFTFFLMDSPDVNAFALPGGYVGINAGLLMMTQNESELASVVAHEIAHVTQRHIARQIEQASRMNLTTGAAMLAAILVGVSTGQSELIEAGVAVGSAAQMQNRINYTRTHEHEADRVGIGMLAAAGYDPLAMATMFEQLERRARLSGTTLPDFLRTHPVNAARITEARDRAKAYDPVERDDPRAYRLMRARARALAMRPHEGEAYFRETLRSAPPDDREALRYGLALTLIDTGKHDEAKGILSELHAAADDVMYYHTALAEADFRSGATDDALARYERAMRLFPRSPAVTQGYAQALLYAGRGREALSHLIAILPVVEPTPQYYRLLAMSSGAAGELADAHYFMSEVHVLGGQLLPAIDQLQLALSMPGINEQQRKRAEARLEQLGEFLPRGRRARLNEPIPRPRQPAR